MLSLVIAFIVAFLISFLLVKTRHIHEFFTGDEAFQGVQKIHAHTAPRVGGISIFAGLIGGCAIKYNQDSPSILLLTPLIACSLPVFIAGVSEDITKRVTASVRLLAAFVSAALAGHYAGAWLSSLQIIGIDNLMTYSQPAAILLTCISVAGVAHSFNIIDGLNGLAGMVGVIVIGGLAYVSFKVGDYSILSGALIMIGALVGFLLLNYPKGLLFLGDGGAYVLGFWIATLSILLTARHADISKWFPLVLCLYPVTETIFTIYRRSVSQSRKLFKPDALHLHQLIYRRVVGSNISSKTSSEKLIRNSLAAPYLWLLSLLGAIPAVIFWDNVWMLRLTVILFLFIYMLIYKSIIKFKCPRLLQICK
jgi:UDP-N-acetylmuramyl pentapeptide phosphotransferase/UDP-N-acetylglucosamine-1-phosphate transferase